MDLSRGARRRLNSLKVFAVTALLATVGGSTSAGIQFTDLYRSQVNQQTGDGATVVEIGYFFSARLYSSTPNEYMSVELTYPGAASPVSLSEEIPSAIPPFGTYSYQTGYMSKMDLDSEFAAGSYDFTADVDSASVMYSPDDSSFPVTTPYLDGSDFSLLQGLNPGNSFTFHFSPYDPGMMFDEAFLFFQIYDQTSAALAYLDGFLPSTTTSLTVPGGTLEFGHDYTYELIFSNRVNLGGAGMGAVFDSIGGYDLRTFGNFTTAPTAAVPEPTSIVMAAPALGLALAFVIRRGRGRRKSA